MRKISLFLAILFVLLMLTPVIVHAEENTYGNAWVYDEANVVSDETEEYIRNLNESIFSTYKEKPQLAFIVINKLPYNIDKYKLDMFNEFGVGTKEENHGMLFVFAIQDREYALEIGDGFVAGSMLRKELETDFITNSMKTSLRNGNYDIVVKQVAEHLANMMADEENGVYAQKEVAKKQNDQLAANAVVDKIATIGPVEYTNECINAIKDAKNSYNKLTAEQRNLVSNYNVLVDASEKIDALQRERDIEILKIVGIVIAALCPVVGIVFLAIWLYKKSRRTKAINNMMEKYSKHMSLLKADPNDIYQKIKHDIDVESNGDATPEYISDAFPRLLCRYYVVEQRDIVREKEKRGELANPLRLYEFALSGANQADSFSKMKVFDAESIIAEVDEEEREKAEIISKNEKAVNDYLAANKCRVGDETLWDKIVGRFTNMRSNCNRLVSSQEIEEHFEKALKELSFEAEFEKFCEEHKDEINNKHFDKQKFYSSLLKENNYAQYRYHINRTYNNMWMMHFLMMHMATQKQEAERREKEEQEARERRRREEEARRQREAMQSHNSSFGSGFSGGYSSGGGFKGGW